MESPKWPNFNYIDLRLTILKFCEQGFIIQNLRKIFGLTKLLGIYEIVNVPSVFFWTNYKVSKYSHAFKDAKKQTTVAPSCVMYINMRERNAPFRLSFVW